MIQFQSLLQEVAQETIGSSQLYIQFSVPYKVSVTAEMSRAIALVSLEIFKHMSGKM